MCFYLYIFCYWLIIAAINRIANRNANHFTFNISKIFQIIYIIVHSHNWLVFNNCYFT